MVEVAQAKKKWDELTAGASGDSSFWKTGGTV
jgi:hypothetical protein